MTLRKLFLAAVFAMLAAAACFARDLEQQTFKCDGFDRKYWIYIPDGLPKDAPLLICMHGHSRKPQLYHGFDEFMDLADKEKFAVCVPLALPEATGRISWNVGYCFQQDDKEFTKKVDDVKFLTRLIHFLQKKYSLSKENVFCTGRSNGGEMCYHLAYMAPGLFKAVAPEYGLTMEWLYKSVAPRKAVPLFELHGTEDHTSEWGGDPVNKGGWGEYISVPLAVQVWATKAKCTHETVEEVFAPAEDNPFKMYLHKYVGGEDGVEVWLLEVVGAGHGGYLRYLNSAETIWPFFKKYL